MEQIKNHTPLPLGNIERSNFDRGLHNLIMLIKKRHKNYKYKNTMSRNEINCGHFIKINTIINTCIYIYIEYTSYIYIYDVYSIYIYICINNSVDFHKIIYDVYIYIEREHNYISAYVRTMTDNFQIIDYKEEDNRENKRKEGEECVTTYNNNNSCLKSQILP